MSALAGLGCQAALEDATQTHLLEDPVPLASSSCCNQEGPSWARFSLLKETPGSPKEGVWCLRDRSLPAIRNPWAGETSQHHQGKRPSSDRRPFQQKFQRPQQGDPSHDLQRSPPERTGGGDRRMEKVCVIREGTLRVPLLG